MAYCGTLLYHLLRRFCYIVVCYRSYVISMYLAAQLCEWPIVVRARVSSSDCRCVGDPVNKIRLKFSVLIFFDTCKLNISAI